MSSKITVRFVCFIFRGDESDSKLLISDESSIYRKVVSMVKRTDGSLHSLRVAICDVSLPVESTPRNYQTGFRKQN